MKPISAGELHQWLSDHTRDNPQLLDVREPWETALGTLPGATRIPMQTLPGRLNELDPELPVVCICHHGVRSAHVAMYLERSGFEEIFNLSGGTEAWSTQVDPSLPRY